MFKNLFRRQKTGDDNPYSCVLRAFDKDKWGFGMTMFIAETVAKVAIAILLLLGGYKAAPFFQSLFDQEGGTLPANVLENTTELVASGSLLIL